MKKFEKIKKIAIVGLFGLILLIGCPELTYAAEAGASVITEKFTTLTDMVTALVSAIGFIMLMWGFFEWGTAMNGPDGGAQQAQAFKRIGGGLIMCLAPQLAKMFL